MWHVELEHRPHDRSARVLAHWTGSGTVINALLRCREGVRMTSFGGSARNELSRYDNPLVGIFRWEEETTAPEIAIEWTDEVTGQRREDVVGIA